MRPFFLTTGWDRANWLGWAAIALSATMMLPSAAQTLSQVSVTAVQSKAVGQGFELDGVVQPVKQSTVSAQASGRILTLLVKAGDKVSAGQLLATIDDQETQTAVQRSQAQVAQTKADLHHAQANFDRTRDLRAQGFVSAAALDVGQAQLESAKAGHDQANAGVKQSTLSQGFTRVTAPFEAWILQTQSQVGDLAVPGRPLLTLYAPLPLRVVVQVPVSKASQVNSKGVVEVLLPTVDGAQQWSRPSMMTHVPTADAVSQTIEWRLELPTSSTQALLPGQQVRVRFSAGQTQRLMLPATAVLRRGELTAVYAVSGKGFVLKAVRLGEDHGADGVEILAGINAGERVASDPVKAGLTGAQAAGQ